jgi:hypothetical protein
MLWDISMGANSSDIPALVNATPRVQLGKIVECPHPCGLLPSIGCNPETAEYGCNGAIPQGPGFNLTLHLSTLNRTFGRHLPKVDDDRLLDLDFESWGPLWDHAGAAYQNASVALVEEAHPSWPAAQVLAQATKDWEAAATELLITTVRFVKQIRPRLKVALYSYPLRAYWNGYNSSSGAKLRADNDRMMDLFCEADALFPSVYQFYNSAGDPNTETANREYVFSNVQEAVRIAKEVPTKCPAKPPAQPLPVWVYAWLRYHAAGSPPPLLSDQDAKMFWEQSWAAGATGLVLWGSESTPAGAAEFGARWKTNFTALINSWEPATLDLPVD